MSERKKQRRICPICSEVFAGKALLRHLEIYHTSTGEGVKRRIEIERDTSMTETEMRGRDTAEEGTIWEDGTHEKDVTWKDGVNKDDKASEVETEDEWRSNSENEEEIEYEENLEEEEELLESAISLETPPLKSFDERAAEFIQKNDIKSLRKVQKFFNEGRAMSTDMNLDKPVKYEKVGGGGTIISHALLGEYEKKPNEIRALEKRWSRFTQSKNSISSELIRVNATRKESILGECKITYRPFFSLLEIFLNDMSWGRLGFLATKPFERLPGVIGGSFAQSNNFRTTYNSIAKMNKNHSFILIPLHIWSDGANFMNNRTGNGSGHPVLVTVPTMSSVQSGAFRRSTRLLAFININEKMENSTSKHNPNIRHKLAAASFSAILKEICHVQSLGGIDMPFFGKMVRIIPYIPFLSGDLVESKKLCPSSSCPFCGKAATLLPYGTRFTQEQRELVKEIENNGIEHYHPLPQTSYKPILSFRELLKMDEGIFGMAPQMPDTLHVLSLGMIKKAMDKLFLAIDTDERQRFENRLRNIPNFPKVFCKTNSRPTTVGADFSCACLLLSVALNDDIRFIKDEQENERFLELLDCFGILLKYSAREIISEEDFAEITDTIDVFPTLIESETDIAHVLQYHLFNRKMIEEFGSPRVYSCARFESYLAIIKRGLKRASNMPQQWQQVLLKRAGKGDLLNRYLDPEPTFSPEIEPQFKKIIFLSKFQTDGFLKADLGFADIARGGTFASSRFVHFQIESKAKPGSRFSVIVSKSEVGGSLNFGLLVKIEASFGSQQLEADSKYFVAEPTFSCSFRIKTLLKGEFLLSNNLF